MSDGHTTVMACSFFDGHGGYFNIASERGFLFQMEFSRAGEMSCSITVDDGILALHRIGKFHMRPFLDDESLAPYFAHDLAMTLDDEISRAVDPSCKFAKDDEVIATNSDACHGGFFVDRDVASSPNGPVPVFANVVVFESNVCAACRA